MLKLVRNSLTEAKRYILGLRNGSNGALMIKSRRKMSFLGFLVCINCLLNMTEWLTSHPTTDIKFLMTYKFSQDHIELFFGEIRSMGGNNNNPSARQFSSAYKKLIIHNKVEET